MNVGIWCMYSFIGAWIQSGEMKSEGQTALSLSLSLRNSGLLAGGRETEETLKAQAALAEDTLATPSSST